MSTKKQATIFNLTIAIALLLSFNSSRASFTHSNENNLVRGNLNLNQDLNILADNETIVFSANGNSLTLDSSALSSTPTLEINGQIKIVTGNEREGYILSSNSEGVADWINPNQFTEQDFRLNGDDRDATSIIGNNNAQDFIIETNDQARLIVKANGNIGINNDDPQAELDINGILQSNQGISLSSSFELETPNNAQVLISRPESNQEALVQFSENKQVKGEFGLIINSEDFHIRSFDNSDINIFAKDRITFNDQLRANQGIRFKDNSQGLVLKSLKQSTTNLDNLNCRVVTGKSSNSITYGSGSQASCNSDEFMIRGGCKTENSNEFPVCSNNNLSQRDNGDIRYECITTDRCRINVIAEVLCCDFN